MYVAVLSERSADRDRDRDSHATEEQAVLISLMATSYVVVVEDAHPKHCMVGTYT